MVLQRTSDLHALQLGGEYNTPEWLHWGKKPMNEYHSVVTTP